MSCFTQSVHGNLQNYLNRIYSQAVVSWNVQVIKGFTAVDLGENGLDYAENELLSAYNPEMNSVISAFKAWQGSINSQAAYLFLVPRADGGLQGYMPFNRQFGFVVAPTGSDGNVDAAALARTVAHELGHGIFSLRHTFSEKNFVTLPQGKTDNLMDYPSTGSGLATATEATKLDKYQWDLIHDPQKVWFSWLEEEKEGEISQIKGTHVVFFGDTAINKERLFVYSDTSKTIKVKFETSDTSKTKVAYQLITIIESSKTKLSYPKNGYDTLIFNEAKEIRLDSIPNGKYSLICKLKVKTIKNKKEIITEKDYTTSFFVRKKKLEITKDQLVKIFTSNKDTARLGAVARAINKYSEEFGLVSVERLSHFIGQIGAETGGLKDLKEIPSYTQKNIYDNCLKPNLRNNNRSNTGKTFKYCDFIEGFNCLDINSDKCSDDPKNAGGHSDCDSVVHVPFDDNGCTWTWTKFDSTYNIKSVYTGTIIFDYWYGCRMGNGPKKTRDGSTFMGRGFIHLTGKDYYKMVSNAWNKLYPNDKKEFHGKDIKLLETDVEIAIKASMVFWNLKELNEIADNGVDENTIDRIGKIVNGSGKRLPNGYELRREFSKSAYKNIK